MGRGSFTYLSYTALLLLSATSATADNLWSVNIDEGPAPSPEDGPPLSFHATRDRHVLPYEIAGIVGSYVFTSVVLTTLLLTLGRRVRKRALDASANQARNTEMVKPLHYAFDPSPISPASGSAWSRFSPRQVRGKKSAASSLRSGPGSGPVSPEGGSVLSFDAGVIEADRIRRAEEMEWLYQKVMAQDDRKSAQQQQQQQQERHMGSGSPVAGGSAIPEGAPPRYERRKPPRLLTDAPSLRHLQPQAQQYAYPTSPLSPMTPKSPVRAIYPPDSPMPAIPTGPYSPIRAEYPTTPLSPAYPSEQQREEDYRLRRERARSSAGSSQAPRSPRLAKKKKALRSLRISSPMPSDNSDGARTPLSPRYYTDPGIPPEPPTARTIDTMDSTTLTYSPTFTRHAPPSPELRTSPPRALPHPAPQRAHVAPYAYANTPQAITDSASTRPPPFPSPPPRLKTSAAPTASPTNPLPFRQANYAWNQPPQQNAYQPHSNVLPLRPPISAGPTKTTFLESHRTLGVPGTGGLRTGAMTPYSPYMPFTPLTPVTPRLTTRRERRAREREERAVMGAVREEDAVRDEGEIWGDGY